MKTIPGTVADVLQGGAYPDVAFIDTGNNAFGMGIIETHLLKGYRDVAESRTPEEALGRMDRFRVLCAHTRGPAGTLQVNHLCQKILRSEGPDGITTPFFRQIVMVTRNDYGRGLFNGDTGVVFETESRPRAWFRDKGKGYPLSQIPAHEAAYAVTIHKAQGSEFDTVLILIPDRLSPVVTRQLLYTGITRARSKVIIAGRPDLIAQAVALSPERRSNLPAGLERILGTLPETENQNPD
jgi:exodeoxyribonuclease V alpha subunit